MQCPRRADRPVQFATLTAQGELDRATADSGDCAKAMTGRRSPCGPLANHRSARRSPPPWRRDNIAGQPARRAGGSRRLISRISIHPLLQLNTERHWLRTPFIQPRAATNALRRGGFFIACSAQRPSTIRLIRGCADSAKSVNWRTTITKAKACKLIHMGASLSNQKVQLTDSITRPDAGSAYRPGDNCSASKKAFSVSFWKSRNRWNAHWRRCPLPLNNKTDLDQ